MTGSISGAVEGAIHSPYCFIAGTAVLTAVGTVTIEEIQAGDQVWAWNEDTGETELKPVVETYINETDELTHVFVDGEEIICTPSHPFYSPIKGWTDACKLRTSNTSGNLRKSYLPSVSWMAGNVRDPLLSIPNPSDLVVTTTILSQS